MSMDATAAVYAGGGGGAGDGGGGHNNDVGIARRVCEVSMDVAALQGLRGSVKVKHALRRVTEAGGHGGNNHAGGGGAQPLGGAVSEGPVEMAAQARQVMSITLADREAPAGPFNKCVLSLLLCMEMPTNSINPHPNPNPYPPTASRSSSTMPGRNASTRSCSAG